MPSLSWMRWAPFAALLAVLLLVLAASAGATGRAGVAPVPVAVFPVPGGKVASPSTQIAFRGLPVSQFGSISVTGSQSGPHSGSVLADSDGQGGSFIPAQPFAPGETVTVVTGLNILGASNGTFQFTVATPAKPAPFARRPTLPRVPGDVWRFRSRPDLAPAAVTITKPSSQTAPGDIFLAPQRGPLQYGPEIVDPAGNLVWFKSLPSNLVALDFRVQRYQGKPVLTWWQGQFEHAHGSGEGVINDSAYRQIAVVKAANGLTADEHEFQITPQGTALVDAFYPVVWDASSVGGSKQETVLDAVAQEIDIPTGLVLFQWDSLDHVPLTSSYSRPPPPGLSAFDYFHINSLDADKDGNILISSRHTSAIYKVSHQTGAVMWTLGGKQSSFKFGPGASFAMQHDVRVRATGDRFITMFDNGGGPPRIESQSRGLKLRLDLKRMTATLVAQYEHSPSLIVDFQGNDQQLPNLDSFVGWGQQAYFSEFTNGGQLIFDGRFVDQNSSYRTYRFPWSGQPQTPPAVAITHGAGGVSTVYASWNGATDVASWRVLAGPSSGALMNVGVANKRGFETAIPVHSEQADFAVQAVGSSGQALSTSPVSSATRSRVSIFNGTSFVSGANVGSLQVGCFATAPCQMVAKISAGRTTLATTKPQTVAAGTGGTVSFALTSAGRGMLARAHGGRLAVRATVRNADGASNSARVNLVPFRIHGKAPRYSVQQSPSLQLISRKVFVSPGGVGGMFAACVAATPCHVKSVLRAGRSVLARTGSEFVGAGDCGTLFFTLTAKGRTLLAHARGNQLGAQLVAVNGGDRASAHIALVGFG